MLSLYWFLLREHDHKISPGELCAFAGNGQNMINTTPNIFEKHCLGIEESKWFPVLQYYYFIHRSKPVYPA